MFDCSEYRRKHMALYGSHDIFRADNQQGSAIRRQSAREAVQDAVLWLKEGNGVAVSVVIDFYINNGLLVKHSVSYFPSNS